MAVKAKATITISRIVDIQSVTRYYLLQSSTASTPSKPTTNPPGGNWVTVEPAFQNGSTNTLYSVELTVFSDDSFDYSDVSKSTSYEAAKEAWNKANNAQNTANSANAKISNLNIGGRNLIKHGQGDKQKGFFKSFSINGDGYLEASMTSKNTNATIKLDEAFVIKPRDYPVGETYIWSYDIMYTKWDFPEGSTCNALWMGQRYTNAPSGQTSTGQWTRITAHDLPKVGSNGCELNKWYHVEQLITIPVQASDNVGVGSQFEFYNQSTTVAASISMRFKNVKLEHGNIATDWTPAPEDLDELVTKLDVMKIGGENLLSNSKELPTDIYNIGGGSIDISTYKGFKVSTGVCNKDTRFTDILSYNGKISPKADTYYTLSFYAKASKNGFIMKSFFYPDCTVMINAPDGNSSGKFSNSGDGMSDNILTTEWKRYWVRWKTTSSVSGVKNILICRLQADVNHSTNDGVQVWVCAPRLEENTFNTNWAPNLMDIESEVTEQGAVMHVMKDSIELKADKTEVTKLGDDVKNLTSTTNSQFKQMSDSLTATVSSVNQIKSNYKLGVYHRANGDSTKNGCISFARITIKNAWCGTPISFGIISTTKQYYNINVRFKHANTTDPDLDYISCDGNVDVYAHKVGTSTWDILCSKDDGGKSDFVLVSDYIFNSSNTELLSNDTAQTKSIGVKWIDQHYDTPTEAQLNSKEYIKAEQLAGKMTKETITSEVKQTAEGLTVKLNKSYHDTSNYSQLNINTASSWNFNYDNTADGRWYTPKTMARDIPISDFYECLGGEKFKIEFEISTSVKGSSTYGGTDQVFVGTTVEIFGLDDTNKYNSYLAPTPIVSGQSTRIMGTDAATPVKVAGSITIPTKCRRFRVFIQTDGWGNWAGTLKIRNIVVSKINAVSDAASTAQSTANTARTEAANAAKTATNYLGFSSAGLTVGDLSKDTLGNNVNINSSSVDIRNGQKVLASYGSDTILYNNGLEVFSIKKSSLLAKAMDPNDTTVGYLKTTETLEMTTSDVYLKDFLNKKNNTEKIITTCDINLEPLTSGFLVWHIQWNPKYPNDEHEIIPDQYKNDYIVIDLTTPAGGGSRYTWNAIKLTFRPYRRNYVVITFEEYGSRQLYCTYLDSYSAISVTLNGGLWINNSGDINGFTEGIPPFGIGYKDSEHLEMDYNEISAKSDNVTPSHLYFNMEGGGVSVNNNCDRAVMFKDGAIYAKNKSFNDGEWIGIVDGLNEAGDTTFGYGGYLNNIGSTNIYGKDINLTSKGDVVANTSFIVPNGSSFQGKNTSGQLRNNFQPCNTNNSCVIGYGSYTAKEGNTGLYGNSVGITSQSDISIAYSGNLRINGTQYDSGWITPTLVSTMTNYGSDSTNAVKYRKIGSVVDIAGTVSPKATTTLANGGAVTLFTLPEAYRPSYTRSFLCQGSARCIFMLQIESNGAVTISRYRNSTSTTDAYPTSVSTNSWLAISATFFVD